MPARRTAVPVLAAAALALTACGTSAGEDAAPPAGGGTGSSAATSAPAATGDPTEGTADDTAEGAAAGAYVDRATYEADPAAYEGSAVVYFFHADWCPSCRATEAAVQESGVPAGLTLVKVDYDEETDLRREPGVTTQHTFVQVDGSGEVLARWTGSTTGEEILARTV